MSKKLKFKKARNCCLLLTSVIFSSLIIPSITKAQSSSCDWFTGEYREKARGVIVHLGQGRLIVYNGRPIPDYGTCYGNRIEVGFENGQKILQGYIKGQNISWTNGTEWRRQNARVTFPLYPNFN